MRFETPLRITGLGPVGGFGSGREAFARALREGCPPGGTLAPTGRLAHRADLAPLDTFLPRRATRRVDTFGRLALLGACLALQDAGLPVSSLGPEVGLVIASGHGATGSTLALQDGILQDGDPFASPIHFANSLHNSAAAQISLLLGLQGPCVTVTQGGLSTASGLLAADSLLRQGQVRRVIFGGVEEAGELTGLLWGDRPGHPGEGASFLVLEVGEGPALARLVGLDLPGEGPVDLPPDTWADRFGEGPGLPAFQLTGAAQRLAEGQPGPLVLGWEDPWEGPATCELWSTP